MWEIRLLWLMLALIWLSAEIHLIRRADSRRHALTDVETGSQRRLWITLSLGLLSGLVLKHLAFWPIAIAYLPRQLLAILLFTAGLALRYLAVKQLGALFTTDVTIHTGHALMTDGPYRHLRHPAYTGLLLALMGAGLAMGDGLALMLMTLPALLALRSRIRIEERMLSAAFGHDYDDFCASRWRLLPWLY